MSYAFFISLLALTASVGVIKGTASSTAAAIVLCVTALGMWWLWHLEADRAPARAARAIGLSPVELDSETTNNIEFLKHEFAQNPKFQGKCFVCCLAQELNHNGVDVRPNPHSCPEKREWVE